MLATIRQITPNEWEAWKALRLEGLVKHPQAYGSSFDEERFMGELEVRDKLKTTTTFGAWLDETLVGTVSYTIMKPLKMKHRAYMFGMYVREEARGPGVSSQLIEGLLNHASQYVTQIHCTVTTDNLAAIAFYKRHKFAIYGKEPSSLKFGDVFYDEYLMVRLLSE